MLTDIPRNCIVHFIIITSNLGMTKRARQSATRYQKEQAKVIDLVR